MKKIIVKLYLVLFERPFNKMKLYFNKKGNKHKCYICSNTFNYFSKYKGGSKNIPDFHKKLNFVGSDVDNFGCPYCLSHDRERHLFMFFDKLNLWNEINKFSVLHFAPEKNLTKKISNYNPVKYVLADFNPKEEIVEQIDARKIPYEDCSFDLVICNHVLEHIPEYLMAISEIYRVLKPNGIAILQTPYAKLLSRNFEDDNIKTDEQRLFFYGEKDHFRIFSENHFFKDLEQAGFKLEVLKNSNYFDNKISNYYGVNGNEDLVKVTKSKE